MPGHGVFAARERDRRKTIELVSEQEEEPRKGIAPAIGRFVTRIPQTAGDVFNRAVHGVDAGGQRIKGPTGLFDPRVFGDIVLEDAFREPRDPTPPSPSQEPQVGKKPLPGIEVFQAGVDRDLDDAAERMQKIGEQGPIVNIEQQALLDEERENITLALDQITEDIRVLNREKDKSQDIFDDTSKMLEAFGLPTTVKAAREDPEVNKLLNALAVAMTSEDPDKIEAATNAIAKLGVDKIGDIRSAFGREETQRTLNVGIQNQIFNLVENRQQVEEASIDLELAAEKNRILQINPIWNVDLDPTPTGRGFDAVNIHMENWLEGAFNGVMTDDQFILATTAFQAIWALLPSIETDVEGAVDPFITQDASASLADLGNTLGFPEEKIVEMTLQLETAIAKGVVARDAADAWKELTQLVDTPLAQSISEVALRIYEDTDEARELANSNFLHEIIRIRSQGRTLRTLGKGNQFGLGNLPEHTYEELGYSGPLLEAMDGNPESQIEALLFFIATKYGTGVAGMEAAFFDLINNPDAWGDLPQ